uniref:Uncharacterized protein n=1 Tax=Tanacetum cinerariifolium TaxID=118510 RepID=A0A6L2JNB3_TANCI|nr:hypothetical protein [Tanacetum cinerariifolium]
MRSFLSRSCRISFWTSFLKASREDDDPTIVIESDFWLLVLIGLLGDRGCGSSEIACSGLQDPHHRHRPSGDNVFFVRSQLEPGGKTFCQAAIMSSSHPGGNPSRRAAETSLSSFAFPFSRLEGPDSCDGEFNEDYDTSYCCLVMIMVLISTKLVRFPANKERHCQSYHGRKVPRLDSGVRSRVVVCRRVACNHVREVFLTELWLFATVCALCFLRSCGAAELVLLAERLFIAWFGIAALLFVGLGLTVYCMVRARGQDDTIPHHAPPSLVCLSCQRKMFLDSDPLSFQWSTARCVSFIRFLVGARIVRNLHLFLSQPFDGRCGHLSVLGAAKVSHFEIMCRMLDYRPSLGTFYPLPFDHRVNVELLGLLDHHRTIIRRYPETLLCLIGLSHSFDDVHVRSTLLKYDDSDMGLLDFVKSADPFRVKTKERTLAQGEVPLNNETMNMTVPPSAEIVQIVEHTIMDELKEHAGKKKKRVVFEDLPAKRLRADTVVPTTGGKSLAALKRLESQSGPYCVESSFVPPPAKEFVSSFVTLTPKPGWGWLRILLRLLAEGVGAYGNNVEVSTSVLDANSPVDDFYDSQTVETATADNIISLLLVIALCFVINPLLAFWILLTLILLSIPVWFSSCVCVARIAALKARLEEVEREAVEVVALHSYVSKLEAGVEAYNLVVKDEFVSVVTDFENISFALLDGLESLKDSPLASIMSALVLKDAQGNVDSTPELQWFQPSLNQVIYSESGFVSGKMLLSKVVPTARAATEMRGLYPPPLGGTSSSAPYHGSFLGVADYQVSTLVLSDDGGSATQSPVMEAHDNFFDTHVLDGASGT